MHVINEIRFFEIYGVRRVCFSAFSISIVHHVSVIAVASSYSLSLSVCLSVFAFVPLCEENIVKYKFHTKYEQQQRKNKIPETNTDRHGTAHDVSTHQAIVLLNHVTYVYCVL